jgi:hypothetical protein
LLLRFSCSPWTLLQLTDTVTAAAVRILVSDSDSALRITVTVTIPDMPTILATIHITVDTAIHIMDSVSAIIGHIMVMDIVDMAAITDIVVDTTVDIMVDIAVVIMADITVVIMADITVDTVADIMADTDILYRNNEHIELLAYS